MKIVLFEKEIALVQVGETVGAWSGRALDFEIFLVEAAGVPFAKAARVTLNATLKFLGYDTVVLRAVGRTTAEACRFLEHDVRQLRTKLEALTAPKLPESTRVDSAR